MSDHRPLWWDFVSEEDKIKKLLEKVRHLETQLQEIKSLNDPLNVKTRDRILMCERENSILHKRLAVLTS